MIKTAIKTSPVETEKRKKLGIRSGMTVRVWQKIQEKGKTRLQAYEGLVIACKHGEEAGATFTVRKVASGVGMEKIFPLYSPNIDKIEIIRKAEVKKSKLYYIREKAAKEIKRRMKSTVVKKVKDEEDELVAQVTEGITVEPEVATEETKEETKE